MRVRTMKLGIVLCAISMTAVLLLSSAPISTIVHPDGSKDGGSSFSKWYQLSERRSTGAELPGLVEPGTPIPDCPQGDPPPERGELWTLASLEGRYIFENARPSYYSYWGYEGDAAYLCADIEEANVKTVDALRIYTGSQPERTIEEADVVKVEGDHLYVLNPYKGFMVFDLTDPLHPSFMGRAPIIGNPFEMYVVGSKAYVIVTASYGWWYSSMWRGSLGIQAVLEDGIGTDESFFVGSKVLVIDLADESDPRVVARFGLEGEVTDSRRVGDIIYFVSSVYGWYARSSGDESALDMTSVMALSMADMRAPRIVDRVKFPSATNVIHVSQQYVFVAQNPSYPMSWSDGTRMTIVDIRDPAGTMVVRGSYDLAGAVSDRYQLDCYDDMLRVVSFDSSGLGSSTLTVLDIEDPDTPMLLGTLAIADAGDLMATRFAGERAYTIHLPRPVRTDPLDVIDLADPSNPRMCDVLEIPGWVTHIEVRGYRLLALGVDSTSWPQGVSMSLFDVTDPDEAVLLSRVAIGEGSAWSTANNDPKALTVLDDRGIALVPFLSYSYDRDSHTDSSQSGVQVVEFDLEDGALRLAGCFEQPDNVLRTRAVGTSIVSTSANFLLAVDLTDLDAPIVTSSIDFRSEVLDLYLGDGWTAAIVRSGDEDALELRTLLESDTEAMCPLSTQRLAARYGTWGWQEDGLLFLESKYVDGAYATTIRAFELEEGGRIREAGTCSLPPKYRFYQTGPMVTAGQESGLATSWQQYGACIDEAVLQLDGALVLKDGPELAIVDVRDPDRPLLRGQFHLDDESFVDCRAVGTNVYLTYSESIEDVTEDYSGDRLYRYSTARERYYLLTIDISDMDSPRASYPMNIPGIPVGASDDEVTLYTVAYWMTGTPGSYVKTLNVVRMESWIAFLVKAIEINMTSMVAMDGDLAYVVTPGQAQYSYYNYYNYYDGPTVGLYDDYDRWYGSPSSYMAGGVSMLWVINLATPEVPYLVSSVMVGESCSAMYIVGGSLVLDLGTRDGLAVMRISDSGGMRLVGTYETTGTLNAIREHDRRGYLAQGEFGITSIDLM